MIQYKIYSNTNLLNIPRELYKAKDSNAAFKTSSLFFGSNFSSSYKNSINTFASDRVASFANFFASSLNSIKNSANEFTQRKKDSNFDASIDKDNILSNNNKGYFETNKKLSDIAPDLGIFINNVNSFLDEVARYENDNMDILNRQVKNDINSSKDDLLAFGITIDLDNKLKLDENVLNSKLENQDALKKIATKTDSIFNKLSDRSEKVLNEPISKYLPVIEDKKEDSNSRLYNYLNNSKKFPLNRTSITGSIIDYTF